MRRGHNLIHGRSGGLLTNTSHFPCLLNCLLEVLEANHDDAEVVERLVAHCLDEKLVDAVSAHLVKKAFGRRSILSRCLSQLLMLEANRSWCLLGRRRVLRLDIYLSDRAGETLPYFIARVLGAESVKDAIASEYNKVMVVFLEVNVENFGIDNDHVRITTVPLELRLAVAKGARHRETARDDSHGTLSDRSTWAAKHDVVVLVHLTTGLYYTLLLCVLRRLVVGGERGVRGALVARHAGSRVSRVCYPYLVIDNEHDDGAGARLVTHLRLILPHECFFGFLEALHERSLRIRRETSLVSNDIVQVVAKELSAAVSSMAVKDGEEARLLDAGCQRLVGLRARLLQIKHNRNAVFVVVARRAVVRVRCVR